MIPNSSSLENIPLTPALVRCQTKCLRQGADMHQSLDLMANSHTDSYIAHACRQVRDDMMRGRAKSKNY